MAIPHSKGPLLCHNAMLPVLQAAYLAFNMYLLRTANCYPEIKQIWLALESTSITTVMPMRPPYCAERTQRKLVKILVYAGDKQAIN